MPAGAEGLILLPYFMGERTPIWDESASGVFMGLSLNHTRGHMYRAILESSAYALRDIVESVFKINGGKTIRIEQEIVNFLMKCPDSCNFRLRAVRIVELFVYLV